MESALLKELFEEEREKITKEMERKIYEHEKKAATEGLTEGLTEAIFDLMEEKYEWVSKPIKDKVRKIEDPEILNELLRKIIKTETLKEYEKLIDDALSVQDLLQPNHAFEMRNGMGDHVLFKERVAQWISEYPEMIPPVCSNRESGQGRYDILLKPKAGKPEWKRDDLYGVVIEIKKGLDKLDQAMEPIQQKEYAQKLKAEGCERIMATAIGVEGKQVELKTAILESS